jgi:hypothetical protein
MNILFSSFLLLSNISNFNINYACVDQNIDATFSNYNNALEYAIYFKPHHNYIIIPFFTFKTL